MHILKDTANFSQTLRKASIILLITLGLSILAPSLAMASWLIEAKKFHISAHGQISCQDCHESIVNEELHPNPAYVSKELTYFFTVDTCLSCHEGIMENLDEGIHGNEKLEDPKGYEYCLSCHEPHYQLRVGENRIGKFDPSKPNHEQCGACHEEQSALPEFSNDDESCISCHLSVSLPDHKVKEKIVSFCFYCHGQKGTRTQEITGKMVPFLNISDYQLLSHAEVECTACHPQAIEFNHGSQKSSDCRQCHLPHDEKVTHDAHIAVACEACHLNEVAAARDPQTETIRWEKTTRPGMVSNIHDMATSDDDICARCHFEANHVGAAAMILPPKSIMCMPCHVSTFSVGDTTTIVALLIFLVGLLIASTYWLSGSHTGADTKGYFVTALALLWNAVKTVFSAKFVPIIKALFYDVFLQRKLFKRSAKRWVIHSLIFVPFIIRFIWGITGLFASLWFQNYPLAWVMINKNHPATAFLFDLTGVMIAAGIVMAFLRGGAAEADRLPSLPKQDRVALSLIGGIVLVGFFLEGLRIALTGTPHGSSYAVIGYGISKLFSGMTGLNDIYGYVWYIHAILAGAFIAYLPFSRLIHIIMAPVVVVMNAATEPEHKRI